ncbi:MAG: hypothetical protein ACLS3C_04480 [Oscillospiraceae bacterium]
MKTLFASISENVQFVLLCLAVTAAVVLLAWGGERLVMKKRHRLNTAHTITTVGMLAAISGVLMVIELPLFLRPAVLQARFQRTSGPDLRVFAGAGRGCGLRVSEGAHPPAA